MSQSFTSENVSIQGLSIHLMHGGQGNPLILVHGGGNDWHEWSANLNALSAVAEIFALDFPGFGLSQRPREQITSAWLSEFMGSLLDTVGLKEASIAGQSVGGLVAADYAIKHPLRVKRLILVDSAGLGKMSLTGWLLARFFSTMAKIKKIERGPKYIPGTKPGLFTAEQLHSLKMPVLIIWGKADHYFPVSLAVKAKRLIPNCTLEIFPGCRHAPQRENAPRFNLLVSDFLSEK